MPRQTLTKRADGRYACKYEGHFFYGKTANEAFRKRDDYVRMQERGYNMGLIDTSFAEYGETWLDTYRTKCNPMQHRQYQSFIDYASEHFGKKMLRSITATDVQRLYNTLAGYSQSHINKFTSTIRSIFRAALQDGVVIRSPAEMAQPPKGEAGSHRALEMWERELIETTYAEHDFGPAAMVMLYAGLRRGEVLYLDVDRDADGLSEENAHRARRGVLLQGKLWHGYRR